MDDACLMFIESVILGCMSQCCLCCLPLVAFFLPESELMERVCVKKYKKGNNETCSKNNCGTGYVEQASNGGSKKHTKDAC